MALVQQPPSYEMLASPLDAQSPNNIFSPQDTITSQTPFDRVMEKQEMSSDAGQVLVLFKGFNRPKEMQLNAERCLQRAENVLAELSQKAANLDRHRNQAFQPQSSADSKSIFSRLSKISVVSRKVGESAARKRLKALIRMDRISLSEFIGQAKTYMKYQKKYATAAAGKKSSMDPDVWMSDAIQETEQTAWRLDVVGSKRIKYVNKPKEGDANTMLLQTKQYKGVMRSQEERLLFLQKALEKIKQ